MIYFKRRAQAVRMGDEFSQTDSSSCLNGWWFFFERIAWAIRTDDEFLWSDSLRPVCSNGWRTAICLRAVNHLEHFCVRGHIFADKTTVFEVNFLYGFILHNTEMGALQYHHPTANNNLVLEQPCLISSQADLEHTLQVISKLDFLEWVHQQRPNSKWVIDVITNVTRFIR